MTPAVRRSHVMPLCCFSSVSHYTRVKALANEDTLLRTHCCRHKCFPVCPRAQHLLRTQKNVSDFVQKHFVSATSVSQFAQPKRHYGQQCVLVYQGLNAVLDITAFIRIISSKLFKGILI